MGILRYLQLESRNAVDPNHTRWDMFRKDSSTRISTGSLLRLTYRVSRTAPAPVVFNGVLLAIKRSTGNPTIIVRGIIDDVGVEQVFSIFSPLLEDIKVLKAAPFKTSKKMYHLREEPSKILKMQRVFKQQEDLEAETKKKSTSSVKSKR